MDTSKIIKGVVNSGRYTVTAPIIKEDYGLYLQIEGVELPSTYEVDFSNSEHNGTSVTMIGNADGVLIPSQFISSGKDVFAFLYHVGADYGRTVYKFRIPNKVRPDRTNEEPTPEEQSVIDQAIGALNTAVEQTAQDVIDADASAQSAQGYAEQAETAKSDAQTYANNAQASATSASQSAQASANSATASANSASQSAQIKADVESLADDAQGYAQASAQSASASANSASQAQGFAQSASASANSASGYASQAQTSAQTASSKASEASQSASQASGYAQTAETAKTDAQTAKTQAETARDEAVTAKTAAETAQGKAEDAQGAAEDAAESVSASAAQIATNTSDISDLKEDLTHSNNEIKRLYVVGKNLIDPVKIASNTILYSDGTTATVSGYNTCDFIPIESGQSITFSRIRKFMAYDTDKNVVSGSWYDGAYENYTYTATSDGFVRASVADNYLSTWQAEYGASNTPYEPYQRFLAIDLGETPLNQVADLIAETNATYLIEDITPSSGYKDNVFIRYDNGGTSGNSAYRATPQIDIRQYTHILYTRIQLASASAQTAMGMAFSSASYLSGQKRISGSELKYISTLIEIPENASSARFTEHKSLTGFYVKGVRKVDIKDIAEKSNILFGKKWAVCGDSFTNGALTTKIGEGKYSNEKVVYPYLIGNRNEMTIIKFFDGGRTLAFPANPSEFTNSITCPTSKAYYQNIPEDADYITIYLGINDEHHATGGGDGEDSTGNIPLGTITDSDTSTYYGAWNVVLTWLITNRPNAHIGIIVTNGLSIEAYRTAQIEIARKYGVPFIDMNGDDRTPAMLRTVNPNIPSAIKQALIAKWAVDPSSNTHPNDAAHLFESYFIENFLRSI